MQFDLNNYNKIQEFLNISCFYYNEIKMSNAKKFKNKI